MARCMRSILAALLLAAYVLAGTPHSHHDRSVASPRIAQRHLDRHLIRRQQNIIDESSTNPVQAAKDVQAIPYLANNASGVTDTADQLVSGDSDEGQLPWNIAVPFLQTPSTTASTAGGWQMVPQLDGFTLNRTWEVVPGAVMPFYSTAGLDPTQIKRAVITFPGKPRDAWKYANLYRNALSVVYANSSFGVANNSVLIISPVWMNELDQEAGGVQGNELYFHGSQWEAGGVSRGPNLTHSLTTYSIVDNFTDMLFNKALFPSLNQVVIAGHSMGGQATHRYAVLKKQKTYEDNMSYWVGNPGSWTYLSTDRPYHNDSCATTYDTWHYGLGGNQTRIPKYARKDVATSKSAVVTRYLGRKVHMALGLLDNGAGDTHCEARDQGGNHLDRGSNYVLHLANVSGGNFPSAQTVDFIGKTSHQDFAMISANQSLHWLFVNDYNTRNADIKASNPGDKNHTSTTTHAPKVKSYATHGNETLASSLLGGSLLAVIAVFAMAPLFFRANFDERAFDAHAQSSAGRSGGAKTSFGGGSGAASPIGGTYDRKGSLIGHDPFAMMTVDSATPLTHAIGGGGGGGYSPDYPMEGLAAPKPWASSRGR